MDCVILLLCAANRTLRKRPVDDSNGSMPEHELMNMRIHCLHKPLTLISRFPSMTRQTSHNYHTIDKMDQLMQTAGAAGTLPAGVQAEQEALRLIFPPHLQFNSNELANSKTLAFCFSGATAGILGLESLTGFVWYLGTIGLLASMYAVIKCQGRPALFFQKGWWDLLSIDQDGFLAFMLCWIGSYAVVHVYD